LYHIVLSESMDQYNALPMRHISTTMVKAHVLTLSVVNYRKGKMGQKHRALIRRDSPGLVFVLTIIKNDGYHRLLIKGGVDRV
jgi:hypothetical protein